MNVNVNTTRFGTVEVDASHIIEFAAGLPGFEQLRTWCLLHLEGADDVNWIQSMEDPDVAFMIADPDPMFANYDVRLDAADLAPLELSEESTLADTHPVIMRVILRREADHFVANLRAPILINLENNKAMQVVLPAGTYSTAERLYPTPPPQPAPEAKTMTAPEHASVFIYQQTVV